MRILKMLATATAIAVVPVAANAAFEPQKETPLGEYVSLECAITSVLRGHGPAFVSHPGRSGLTGLPGNGQHGGCGLGGGIRVYPQTSSSATVASPNFGRRTFILSIIER